MGLHLVLLSCQEGDILPKKVKTFTEPRNEGKKSREALGLQQKGEEVKKVGVTLLPEN